MQEGGHARELGHNFAHAAQPQLPPLPPSPPSPPPFSPPPPPLQSIFPLKSAMILIIVFLFFVCVGYAVKFAKDRKKKKAGDVDVDVKGGDKEGGDGEAGKDGGDGGGDNLEGPKEFRKRGCTDFCCVLLFGIFWLGMLYCFYLGLTVGDPYSVLYGKDYLGQRCGRGNMTSKPKVIFPRLGQDILAQMDVATTKPWKLVLYGLCVETCPNITDPTICFGQPGRCMTYAATASNLPRAAP